MVAWMQTKTYDRALLLPTTIAHPPGRGVAADGRSSASSSPLETDGSSATNRCAAA